MSRNVVVAVVENRSVALSYDHTTLTLITRAREIVIAQINVENVSVVESLRIF